MAGGYKPNGGAPKGTPNGGRREGAGRKTNAEREAKAKELAEKKANSPTDKLIDVQGKVTPLEYALAIINDPSQDDNRRDRMAIAALPFMHMKKGEGGKKEQQVENASTVSKGKFSSNAPPRLVVNNK